MIVEHVGWRKKGNEKKNNPIPALEFDDDMNIGHIKSENNQQPTLLVLCACVLSYKAFTSSI